MKLSECLDSNIYPTDHVLPYADEIIVLDQGTVVDRGSYEEISQRIPEISSKKREQERGQDTEPREEVSLAKSTTRQSETIPDAAEETTAILSQPGNWPVYHYWFSAVGWFKIGAFCVCLVAEAFTQSYMRKLIILCLLEISSAVH